MSQFARLFSGLMQWNLDGWWWLTLPMTEREWDLYYVQNYASDDLMVGAEATLDQINDALELRAEQATRDPDGDLIDREPEPRRTPASDVQARSLERIMDLGRARLDRGCEES